MSNTTPRAKSAKQAAARCIAAEIRLFFLVLGIFFLIGLAFWARPKHSEVEKRDLASFPRMTAASLWDGSFFSGVTTWYADTYPTREKMISAGASLENLYGIRTEKVIMNNAGNTADAIPDLETVEVAAVDFAALRASEEMAKKDLAENELDTDAPDGAIKIQPEAVGTVYIAGGSGFSVYYFNQDSIDSYVSMLNTVQQKLGSGVDVYAIPTPDSFGIMLDRSIQESLTQYEGDAFDYFFKRLSPDVKGVNIFNILTNHNAEYIFFRTDHHWTALGAYYAYLQFCSVKGFEPHDLSEFEEYVSGEYLGTFYSYSNHSPELAANPDHIYAYYPLSTNTMMMETHDGQFLEFPIIREGDTYDLFIGSDEPFEVIDNPLISDGSACVLIKDSMGNAFVPFLVDHYDKVFVIDYRYYQGSHGSLAQLIEEEGIDDVLFMNNIEFLSGSLASSCYDLFQFDETAAPAAAAETPVETAEDAETDAPESGDTADAVAGTGTEAVQPADEVTIPESAPQGEAPAEDVPAADSAAGEAPAPGEDGAAVPETTEAPGDTAAPAETQAPGEEPDGDAEPQRNIYAAPTATPAPAEPAKNDDLVSTIIGFMLYDLAGD